MANDSSPQTDARDVAGRLSDRAGPGGDRASILPLATSVDGRSFDAPGVAARPAAPARRLRRPRERRAEPARAGHRPRRPTRRSTPGEGPRAAAPRVLVRLAAAAGIVLDADGAPFHDAARPAGRRRARSARGSRGTRPDRAGLTVGELLLAPGVPGDARQRRASTGTRSCAGSPVGQDLLARAAPRAGAGGDRRCGWSSSTRTPTTSGWAEVRDGADPERAAALRRRAAERRGVAQRRRGAEHPLRLRFAELDAAAQAAMLGLDPVARPGRVRRAGRPARARSEDGTPLITGLDAAARLASARARGSSGCGPRNLGVLDWGVWARRQPLAGRGAARARPPAARSSTSARWTRTQEQRAGRGGRAGDAVGAAPAREPVPGRHRRGAQHLPGRARRTR